MKKSDIMLRIASLLLFIAMVAYMTVYIVRRFTDPLQTALVVSATMTDSSTVSGLVVRDELVISSDAPYINVVVTDGEKVGAGQTVAVVYGSDAALDRATRLSALETEIRDVEAVLSGSAGVGAIQNRDKTVYSAITELSAAVRTDNYTSVDTRQSTLAGLVFRSDTTNATEEYLADLWAEYRELSQTSAGDTDEIAVAEGGTFTVVLDGFEGVNPEYAKELTPSELREMIATDHQTDVNAIGKLITSYRWYYAAIVAREDASKLVAGRTVQLSFGRYYSEYVTAKVEYVGQAEGNEQLILFSIDKGFSDMLAVRAVAAEIVYSEYTGLRIPLRCLYRYYAGYLSDDEGALLTEGGEVTLRLGTGTYIARVSEVSAARRYGDLPPGVEANSDADTRPKHRLVVFYWPYNADETVPDSSAGGGTVSLPNGMTFAVTNYYEYREDTDRMCTFAMTGLQAERKKVTLIYAGEEYALVSSDGSDALREGNELIVQAVNLHNGQVFR